MLYVSLLRVRFNPQACANGTSPTHLCARMKKPRPQSRILTIAILSDAAVSALWGVTAGVASQLFARGKKAVSCRMTRPLAVMLPKL